MVLAEGLFADRQCTLVEVHRLRVAALHAMDVGQGAERPGDLRMVLAERLLADRQRAPVERFRLRMFLLRPVEEGEITERLGNLGVVLAECPSREWSKHV